MTKIIGVVTSINPPTPALLRLIDYASASHTHVVVVGDVKTPNYKELKGCSFVSIESQKNGRFSEFSSLLPENHYARKNAGYLEAWSQGPEWIYETDDDNFPEDNPFKARTLSVKKRFTNSENYSWVNHLKILANLDIKNVVWPRGFPLDLVFSSVKPLLFEEEGEINCPIVQGWISGEADVDAIGRLMGTPGVLLNSVPQKGIVVKANQNSVFNSQNTWWHKSAQNLMYLPSHCPSRASDIIRSYIVFGLMNSDLGVHFSTFSVKHERNYHDTFADLKEELLLYKHAHQIMRLVRTIDKRASLTQRIHDAYSLLASKGILDQREIPVLESYLWHNENQERCRYV